MNNNIDFVVTWVDGNDPLWRKERARYAALEYQEQDNNTYRYRDWETLKYLFRGIEKFTPWVNKVYFVTCGHIPEWLDTTNPKLQVVKHSDFIPSEYLPTFNSNVIELHLHRIEGLSEQFVYFNDDCFILDYVSPTRFFKNGLPCDLGGMTMNFHGGMFGATVLLAKTLINDNFDKRTTVLKSPLKWFNIHYLANSIINLICCLIRKNDFLGFINPHLAQAFKKNVFENVWKSCENDLKRTSSNRFRDFSDVAFWVVRYWQLASNSFSPCNVNKDSKYYRLDDKIVLDVAKCISQQKKRLICLNDSKRIEHFEEVKEIILKAFEKVLPEKSMFEK